MRERITFSYHSRRCNYIIKSGILRWYDHDLPIEMAHKDVVQALWERAIQIVTNIALQDARRIKTAAKRAADLRARRELQGIENRTYGLTKESRDAIEKIKEKKNINAQEAVNYALCKVAGSKSV